VAGSSRRATHGRLLLGSTTERLVGGAPCPVAVVPAGWAKERLSTIGASHQRDRARVHRRPADVLVDLSRGVDVMVCGSRGYGPLRAVLLGSVTRRLANEAYCPVIVLPRGVRSTLEALVEESAATAA
jgi:nucleotide-binding universal stress UspA family protein